MTTKRRMPQRTNPAQLPKFWRPKITPAQQLDCKVIHWDLIDRFTAGTATRADLWDWMETGFTYSQLMRLLASDGIEFTPEAMNAVAEQLASYEAVATRFAIHGRAGFTAIEMLTARAAAQVFDSLIELDRHSFAEQAARWSADQMARITLKALAA